jgi:hypothetical protein
MFNGQQTNFKQTKNNKPRKSSLIYLISDYQSLLESYGHFLFIM